MNETLKAAGHIGAELGAALAENERLRKALKGMVDFYGYAEQGPIEAARAALSQQAGPCGGCGNSDESKRCIGCGHRFEKSAEPMCETMQRPKSQCGCPDCGSSLVDWPKAEPAPAQDERGQSHED